MIESQAASTRKTCCPIPEERSPDTRRLHFKLINCVPVLRFISPLLPSPPLGRAKFSLQVYKVRSPSFTHSSFFYLSSAASPPMQHFAIYFCDTTPPPTITAKYQDVVQASYRSCRLMHHQLYHGSSRTAQGHGRQREYSRYWRCL